MIQQDKPVKFAVVGCGYIGKRHIQAIEAHPDAVLSEAVDHHFSEEQVLPNVSCFLSVETMLQSDIEAEIVVIATPNGNHFEQAIQVLASGRHVLVEKPLALSSVEISELEQMEKQTGKKVFVVQQNRFSPVTLWLKEILDSNRLGKLFVVQFNCWWNRDEKYYKPNSWHGTKKMDGGTLFTQFSHFIDILSYCFGEISDIRSQLFDFNHTELTEFEDTGIVSFRLKDEGVGQFNFSTAVFEKNLESTITILAEKGTVKIGGQYMDEVQVCHIKDYIFTETKSSSFDDTLPSAHYYVINNVIEVLRKDAEISAGLADAKKVTHIIEQIYAGETHFQKIGQ